MWQESKQCASLVNSIHLQENQRYQGNISCKDEFNKGQKWYGLRWLGGLNKKMHVSSWYSAWHINRLSINIRVMMILIIHMCDQFLT